MPAFSRRWVIASTGALSLSWLLAQAAGHRPHQGPPGAALSSAGRAILIAALEALLPEGAPAQTMVDEIDAFLASGEPYPADDLSSALLVLEHTGGTGPLGFRSFSRLSRDERAEVLASWMRSRIALRRQIADALRRMALFSWYSRPEVWPGIGYDGPWVRS